MQENFRSRILPEVKEMTESGRMPRIPNDWELSGQSKLRYNLGVCEDKLNHSVVCISRRIVGETYTWYKHHVRRM